MHPACPRPFPFAVIVDGVVDLSMESDPERLWHLHSGEMFDYRLFNLFGIYLGERRGPIRARNPSALVRAWETAIVATAPARRACAVLAPCLRHACVVACRL